MCHVICSDGVTKPIGRGHSRLPPLQRTQERGTHRAADAHEINGLGHPPIYYSKGDGTFYQGTVLDPSQGASVLAVGDFNGDGKPDLAVGLELSQQVALFFNQGQGQFTRSFVASGASDSISMVAADLNGDGKPDLVIVNFFIDFVPPNVDVVFHK